MVNPLLIPPTKVEFTLSLKVSVDLFDKAYPTPRDREKAVLDTFTAIVLPSVKAAALQRFLVRCRDVGVEL